MKKELETICWEETHGALAERSEASHIVIAANDGPVSMDGWLAGYPSKELFHSSLRVFTKIVRDMSIGSARVCHNQCLIVFRLSDI